MLVVARVVGVYVSAIVTILPCRVPPLQVPCDFSVSSSVIGSILKRYVQTHGRMTAFRCLGGHGVPNIPCAAYLSSCDHSDFSNLGRFSSTCAFRRVSLGISRPFMTARAMDTGDMLGHLRGLLHNVSPVAMACR
jgi:hypothetical protein